ncbi:MAG: efflux RND transporter periplasmic adaptor subunit [Luminiphilus sp.]
MTSRMFFTTLFSAVGAAGIVLFGSNAIEANVRPTISTEAKPLPVAVVPFQLETSYTTTTRFLGVIEATSDSNVGFEVAGVLKSLSAREGDFVTTGQSLGQLDIRQQEAALSLATAQAKEVSAELERAKLNLQRIDALLRQGLISQREADDSRLTVDATSARLETTQASVRNAEIVIEKSQLIAPFDAVVSKTLREPGSVMSPNVPVLRLVSVGERQAHVGISPKYADLAQVGEAYSLYLDDTVIPARLRSIGSDVDPQTLTVLAVLALPEGVSARVGQTVAMQFEERVTAPGGWLPLSALLEGDKGLWTVLVTRESESGTIITARESVEVIYNEGDRVYVRGTVANGAAVVASGVQRLSPGSPVEIVPNIRVIN